MYTRRRQRAPALRRLRRVARRARRPSASRRMRQAAQLLFHRVGITFAVYGEDAGAERLIPFDILPHVIPGEEWRRARARGSSSACGRSTRSCTTSTTTRRSSRRARSRPSRCRATRSTGRRCAGIDVPGGIYAHIAGIDLVRARRRRVLRARGQPAHALRRVVHAREPQDDDAAVARAVRAPVDRAGRALSRPAAGDAAQRGAARRATIPTSCCSRPGQYNSAYFEHAFLAQQMGIELVEGAGPVRQGRRRSTCAPPAARSAWT